MSKGRGLNIWLHRSQVEPEPVAEPFCLKISRGIFWIGGTLKDQDEADQFVKAIGLVRHLLPAPPSPTEE